MSPFKSCLKIGKAVFLTTLLWAAVAHADFDSLATRSWEDQTALKFQYRLSPAAEVESVEVSQNGKALEFRHTPFANNPLNTSAILVMVDTSVGSTRAPRDHTLADNKGLIQMLLAQAQPRNVIGVYAFSNDLVEVAPLGAPFTEIRAKIAPLKADGLGTRIYRQGMRAIEKLAATPATRKSLLIISDGKDEDNGFTRDDLVKSAQLHGVNIYAMGCPETGSDIPALGNLEKIAFETHGLYTQVRIGTPEHGERQKTDAAFVQAVLASVNSGGEVVLPLDLLSSTGGVTFALKTKGGERFTYLHKRPGAEAAPTPVPAAEAGNRAATPVATPTPAPSATPAGEPSPVATPVPAATPAKASAPAEAPWNPANWILGGATVLLVLAVVVLRRKKVSAPAAPARMAYLVMQDAESKRIPLVKTANRIGRRPDNDIVFSNTSISGYHAEIHVQRDGSYSITDLASGNGLCVNEQRVPQSPLKDGDLIEMGEVRFRFHIG